MCMQRRAHSGARPGSVFNRDAATRGLRPWHSPCCVRGGGIEPLPTSLEQALAAMEASELVRETLGEHVFAWFLANKVEEWNAYRSSVTTFEVDRYLSRL